VVGFSAEFQQRLTDVVRATVARRGDDPRLVERVEVGCFEVLDLLNVRVVLRDGRDWVDQIEGVEFVARSAEAALDLVAAAAMRAAGCAFAVELPASSGFATEGLASDGWWREVSLATADAGRRWARELLRSSDISAAQADRFIASLDPPKREDLLRRAVAGEGVEGF
jgi:hypothetical protein